MYTIVLLTERALTAHDVERVAHLHDPEPVRIHVVVPAHDEKHSEVDEAVDDIAATRFRDAMHDEDEGKSAQDLTTAAGRELAATIEAFAAAGLTDVDGEVVAGAPVRSTVAIARRLEADEAVVYTEPHLVADLTRRDWGSRLRHELRLPVLHVVLGTDQVVS